MESKYSNEQLYTNYPDGIEHHYWNLSRNKIIVDLLNRYDLTQKRVLEIGCGRGIVVQYLDNHNIDCYGVDIADGTPVQENDKIFLGTNALDLDLVLKNSVEVILLLDVIEHIENPEVFLGDIQMAFPNAGWFIIAVPARKEIWSNYDQFYGHFRRYNKHLLCAHVSVLDGKIERIHYLYHLLYYPALLLKVFNIKRNVYLRPPKGDVMKKIHYLLAILFHIEYKLRLSRMLGTSVISLINISHTRKL